MREKKKHGREKQNEMVQKKVQVYIRIKKKSSERAKKSEINEERKKHKRLNHSSRVMSLNIQRAAQKCTDFDSNKKKNSAAQNWKFETIACTNYIFTKSSKQLDANHKPSIVILLRDREIHEAVGPLSVSICSPN